MAIRKKGSVVFNASLEVEAGAPLDAREVTDLLADLTDAGSFPYFYEGMKVYVKETKKTYTLVGDDTTDIANWVEVGSGSAYDDTALSGRVTDVEDAIDTLNGDSTVAGSVAKTVSDAIDALIDGAPGTYDTLKEIADYISADQTAAAAIETALAGKVDKVDGKQLSTNDYSNEEKARIDALETAIQSAGTSDGKTAVAITVSNDIGNYGKGDVIDAGTAFEQIFKTMLSKTLVPVLTPPSAGITTTANKLLETGSTVTATFVVTYNRGSINPAYGTDGFRAGEATGYILNGGPEQVSNTFSEEVSESNKTFSATVKYGEGTQPKNSDGANYDEPLQAGQVNTNTITFEFVDALWSNAANIANIVKEQLVSKSAGVKVFNAAAQTAASPFVFDVPASWTVSAVELYNTLSGQWGSCTAEFTVTDFDHDGVAYKRYTNNLGYGVGDRQYRIKWT